MLDFVAFVCFIKSRTQFYCDSCGVVFELVGVLEVLAGESEGGRVEPLRSLGGERGCEQEESGVSEGKQHGAW